MELAEPDIASAIAHAVADGHSHILCQPALLLAAGHAKNDLPTMLRAIAEDYPTTKIRYGSPVQISSELVSLCSAQILRASEGMDLSSASLLVVGRGTSDPDANSNVAKLARLLEECLGFSESSVCFFSTTSPRLPAALEKTANRTDSPIVLFPFILFAGVLNELAMDERSRVEALHPGRRIVCSAPIGTLHDFTHLLLSRIESSTQDGIDMPCLACKYRSPLPGFEKDAGAPQTSHHHDHDHDHHHGHCHPNPCNPKNH